MMLGRVPVWDGAATRTLTGRPLVALDRSDGEGGGLAAEEVG